MAAVNWNTGDKFGLVDIGTTSLSLQVSGPNRQRNVPVILIIQGLGSCASSWAAVIRNLSPHHRVVVYDRAGLGNSQPSQLRPSLYNIIKELKELLRIAQIDPPYLLVAHSWGGVLAQKFMASVHPDHFSGLVLVEANNELTLRTLDWRPLGEWILQSGIDRAMVLDMESRHGMLPVEWKTYKADRAKPQHIEQGKKEYAQYALSFSLLADQRVLERQPPLLGFKPVEIIIGSNGNDMAKLATAAAAKGFGNEEELSYFKHFIGAWGQTDYELQCVAKGLSGFSAIHKASDNSGHDVHVTEPAFVAGVVMGAMKSVEIQLMFHGCGTVSSVTLV